MLKDLLLPKTDSGVFLQWAIMAPIWVASVALTWRWQRDLKHFVWGLITVNLAWFMLRTAH